MIEAWLLVGGVTPLFAKPQPRASLGQVLGQMTEREAPFPPQGILVVSA